MKSQVLKFSQTKNRDKTICPRYTDSKQTFPPLIARITQANNSDPFPDRMTNIKTTSSNVTFPVLENSKTRFFKEVTYLHFLAHLLSSVLIEVLGPQPVALGGKEENMEKNS